MGTGKDRGSTPAPNMIGEATSSSATPATHPLRRLVLVIPPQIPGNQVRDSGFRRVRAGPMTDTISSGKEGPTRKEPTALQQITLEDMLLPPHQLALQSVAGTHILDDLYRQLLPWKSNPQLL